MSAIDLTRRFRVVLGLFILALIVSGVTAFPLRWELNWLASWMGIRAEADPASLSGLAYWIAHVRSGLEQSYDTHPFLAYGTDWLAFAHIVIAVFFIGPLREPTRHDWILVSGILACIGVVPLALICGPLRGIPMFWRCIDCWFALVGFIPFLYCLAFRRKLKAMSTQSSAPPNGAPATPLGNSKVTGGPPSVR